jgi:hypothetical protein
MEMAPKIRFVTASLVLNRVLAESKDKEQMINSNPIRLLVR